MFANMILHHLWPQHACPAEDKICCWICVQSCNQCVNTKSGKAWDTNETKSFQFTFTSSFNWICGLGVVSWLRGCWWRAEGSAWQEVSKEGQCLALGSAEGRGHGKPQSVWYLIWAFGPCLNDRIAIPLGTLTIRTSETQLQPGNIFILGNLISALVISCSIVNGQV